MAFASACRSRGTATTSKPTTTPPTRKERQMPDSFTTNLNLTLPEVGASRDTWGTKTNDNWNVVDEFLFMSMPIGAVLDFAGAAAPDGWLICDGRLVSRTTYSQLFAVRGTAVLIFVCLRHRGAHRWGRAMSSMRWVPRLTSPSRRSVARWRVRSRRP